VVDVVTVAAVRAADDVVNVIFNEPDVQPTAYRVDPSATPSAYRLGAPSLRILPWNPNCCWSGGIPVFSYTFSLTYSMVSDGPILTTTLSSVEITTVICLSLGLVVIACIPLVELVGLVVFLKEVDGTFVTLVDVTSVVVIVDIGIREVVDISIAFDAGVLVEL